MRIHYWDFDKTIEVEDYNRRGEMISFTIRVGKFEMEIEGDYYGPAAYYHEILLYDLIGLIALHKEVYPR